MAVAEVKTTFPNDKATKIRFKLTLTRDTEALTEFRTLTGTPAHAEERYYPLRSRISPICYVVLAKYSGKPRKIATETPP